MPGRPAPGFEAVLSALKELTEAHKQAVQEELRERNVHEATLRAEIARLCEQLAPSAQEQRRVTPKVYEDEAPRPPPSALGLERPGGDPPFLPGTAVSTEPGPEASKPPDKLDSPRATVSTQRGATAMGCVITQKSKAHFVETSPRKSERLDKDFTFAIWPVWSKERPMWGTSTTTCRFSSLDDDDNSETDSKAGDPTHLGVQAAMMRMASRWVVHPATMKRIVWDLLGCVFVGYDFIVVPLQFLQPPESTFFACMLWVIRIYWTLDFPFSFFTGYSRDEGKAEVRLRLVARRYLLTWMPFDLMVLVYDWTEFFLSGGEEGATAARMGKTLKAVRLLRMVRLVRMVRLMRLPDFASRLLYQFQSERAVITFGIVRIMVLLAGLAHSIACFWYGLGCGSGDVAGWVEQHGMLDRPLGYRYGTAFHWALTIFTGTMEVYPYTLSERTFAVVVLFVGFLVAASIVSAITSSMTRLQIVTMRKSTQISALNHYLLDNGISTKVALRVQRNALYALQQEEKNTPETSIELLKLVSEPLRVELHYEINLPVLASHPFFRHYNEVNEQAMRRTCHTAISRLGLSKGDILFSAGEERKDPQMYFFLTGHLRYLREGEKPQSVQAISWACEAVLWTPWVHCGSMQARTECILATLAVTEFQTIATQHRGKEFLPRMYADLFVEQLNAINMSLLTDLEPESVCTPEEMCMEVFPSFPCTDGHSGGIDKTSSMTSVLPRKSTKSNLSTVQKTGSSKKIMSLF